MIIAGLAGIVLGVFIVSQSRAGHGPGVAFITGGAVLILVGMLK